MIDSDSRTADRAAQHLQKVVGVRAAVAFAPGQGVARELALVKVRAPHAHSAELLDIAQLYHASVLDETPEAVILELSGTEPFVLSALRALERFEIIEVARSGTVALESGTDLQSGITP
jgi:acetolactate synthase-1/3 small subunit